MENVTKTNNSQTLVSTTYTITAGDVTDLMKNLMALGADASQEQLAEVVNGRELKEICAVSNLGESISGSAERAVAAALNVLLPPEKADQYSADDDFAGCTGWFTSEHGDKDKWPEIWPLTRRRFSRHGNILATRARSTNASGSMAPSLRILTYTHSRSASTTAPNWPPRLATPGNKPETVKPVANPVATATYTSA